LQHSIVAESLEIKNIEAATLPQKVGKQPDSTRGAGLLSVSENLKNKKDL